jgi:hypothetical protein
MSPQTSHDRVTASFPFECVETSWDLAVSTWEQLKAAGRGFPVVIGNDNSLGNLAASLCDPPSGKTVEEILTMAGTLRHPESLYAELVRQIRVMNASSGAAIPEEPYLPPLGRWPDDLTAEDESLPDLTGAVLHHYSGGLPERVNIALVPTGDWTTIPAHFRWGGWEGCPAPEFHVAALRSWRDRFGAELVAMSDDTMDLRVSRPPRSRQDALNLAREHYLYCTETAGEGIGTLSNSAAKLLAKSWWYFWWDRQIRQLGILGHRRSAAAIIRRILPFLSRYWPY